LISPILFPDIIYKYANLYNQAYVIVESNDAGQLTCHGLHYELEYENLHMESSVKALIGTEMTRRTKRIGCSGFKDLMEEGKLHVVDEETIMEISTFEVKGQSYEATDGNHDDLVMNFVMLGYFISTPQFQGLTNVNARELMFEQRAREIEDDVPPFGLSNDDPNDLITYEQKLDPYSLLDFKDDDGYYTNY
jgi:hypothetical protein